MVVVVRGGTERRRATGTCRHGTDGSDGSVTRQPVLKQCNQLLLYINHGTTITADTQIMFHGFFE
jgi:hypothetical protein